MSDEASDAMEELLASADKMEQLEAEAIKLDPEMYQYLTEEVLKSYLPLIFSIGEAEGDYIAQFDRKAKGRGITVKDEYVKEIWETHKPVPGVDTRSGEYGIDVAGMGFMKAGCEFMDKGDEESALENWEKAVELCPRNFMAWAMIGQVHGRNEAHWLSAAVFTNAIIVNPVYIAEHDSKSREVLENFYPESLSKEYDEYLAHAFHWRGAAYSSLKKYDEAIADFSEAIKRDPSLLTALEERVKAYGFSGRYDEAIADCDTLLASGYEKARMHLNKGICLRMEDRFMEAIRELSAAIELNPEVGYAYLHRNVCNWQENILEDAVNDATEAIKRNVPNAHFYRGQAYRYAGFYTKAIEDYEVAHREYPNDEDTEWEIKYARREQTEGAIRGYERKNEKGEWEEVRVIDEKIDSIEPAPNHQQYLDEHIKRELDSWLEQKARKASQSGKSMSE